MSFLWGGECTKIEEKIRSGTLPRLEYLDWYIKHDVECLQNHDASPQKMESDGVMELYQRSINKYSIRYNPYIGDGDSSSYSAVDRERPYGPNKFIEKQECVNHVTKRMGTNLRALTRDYKGKKLSDGKSLGGRGRLTTLRIDAIRNFYGRTIRGNKEQCKTCSNQNANKSFNSLVWSLSPKETFNSPTATSLAINIAVCLFNDGFEATSESIYKDAGLNFTHSSLKQWQNIDKERLENADYVNQESSKQRRKKRKRSEIKKQGAFQHKEGVN